MQVSKSPTDRHIQDQHSVATFLQLLFQAARKNLSVRRKNKHFIKEKLDSTNPNALVQVGVRVVITVKFGQVNQDSGGAAAVSGPAEAAVADAPAGRAPPLLMGGQTHHI